MNPLSPRLTLEETQAVLSTALREVQGGAAQLEGWTAEPLAKRGKQRVVRYSLRARVADLPRVSRSDWWTRRLRSFCSGTEVPVPK